MSMTRRVSPAPRSDIFMTMQAAKKGSTRIMVRKTGMPKSTNAGLPGANKLMNIPGMTKKMAPKTPMKMTAYLMHLMMVMRAMSALRAPRYCPTRVDAAMPMAKPGKKLSDSMRMAIL